MNYRAEFHRLHHKFVLDLPLSVLTSRHLEKSKKNLLKEMGEEPAVQATLQHLSSQFNVLRSHRQVSCVYTYTWTTHTHIPVPHSQRECWLSMFSIKKELRSPEAGKSEQWADSKGPTGMSLPNTGFQCLPYSGWVELVKMSMILTPDSSPWDDPDQSLIYKRKKWKSEFGGPAQRHTSWQQS